MFVERDRHHVVVVLRGGSNRTMRQRGCCFSSKAGTLWVGHRACSQPSKRAAGGQGPRACLEAVQKPVRSGWGCLRPCATVATVGRLVFSYRDLHRRRRSGAISSRQMVDPGREALPPPDPVTFESPPVMQVILGVEFAGPVIAEAAVLADFWNAIREEFPEVKKQPIMQPMAENFDVAQPQQFEVRIGGPGGGPERYWIENEDRSWVVQVQPDRFALNWKRPDESAPYPRYRAVRERFQDLYGKFIAAADNQLLEENPPSWCATTYANEIAHPDSTDPLHGPIDDILNFIHRPDSDVLPTVEDTWIRQRRLLRDEGDQPRGRLYIEARPTLTSPPESIPGYRLSLRVVAQPRETSDEGVLDCQDESRDLIVRSFKDITTPKMHVLWGLRGEDGN